MNPKKKVETAVAYKKRLVGFQLAFFIYGAFTVAPTETYTLPMEWA